MSFEECKGPLALHQLESIFSSITLNQPVLLEQEIVAANNFDEGGDYEGVMGEFEGQEDEQMQSESGGESDPSDEEEEKD